MNASRKRARRLVGSILQAFLVLLVLLFVLGPVLWLVTSSLSAPKDLLARPPHWLPWPPDFSKYKALIAGSGKGGPATTLTESTLRSFRYAMGNSLVASCSVTLICLALGTLSGYAAARSRSKLGSKAIYLMLIVQMLPVVVLLVPLFLIISKLGLLDKLGTVVVLLSAIHLPFVIWILRGYFQGIPLELEEAALVDGATRLKVIRKVVLPLSLPGLVAAGTYTFMQSWNAFMIPLLFTSSDTTRTVTVAISMFVGRHYTDYALMSAAGVLASLPPMLLAIFFQRYLLAGLTSGAVKG
jgi:ABC-type sugar transport system, permease component